MITAQELASRKKIKDVIDQIEAIEAGSPVGAIPSIKCPYCGDLNVWGQNFCCELLRRCVITVLIGKRQAQIDKAIGAANN